MHCEDLLVDNSSDRETIEAICEGFPQFNVISAFAFVIKSINPIDTGAFMVASQDEEVFGIFDLVRKEKADGLQ